ncbi:MAG: hypothetical protein RQ715_00010 [Methylococcales bacterium]|nr:hypothetical protein [Methylococcales bacterium]
MKTIIFSLFAVAVASGSAVMAEAKYPASDFQPKVQYRDDSYSNQAQDVANDADYPATNFKPTVVYKDDSYQHKGPEAAAGKVKKSTSPVEASGKVRDSLPATTTSSVSNQKEQDSSSNLLLIILVIAGIAVFLFRKQSGGKVSAGQPAYQRAAAAAVPKSITRVDEYLRRRDGEPATRVAQYLERKADDVKVSAQTTVEKYLDKKAEATETGVAKYLRRKS